MSFDDFPILNASLSLNLGQKVMKCEGVTRVNELVKETGPHFCPVTGRCRWAPNWVRLLQIVTAKKDSAGIIVEHLGGPSTRTPQTRILGGETLAMIESFEIWYVVSCLVSSIEIRLIVSASCSIGTLYNASLLARPGIGRRCHLQHMG